MSSATLISCKSHLFPGKLNVSELFFEVPVDYEAPGSGSIRLFASSITKYETPTAPIEDEKADVEKSLVPWLVYLQGGPGIASPAAPGYPAFTNFILKKGYQILYLDTRGTGLSTPVSSATLALKGNSKQQAEYLKHFRADNIVRDCEAIRKTLTQAYPEHLKKWTLLGQSFGGHCIVTYLSMFPDGVREAFSLGGIPGIGVSPEDVYRATFAKVIERNKVYYKKYPEDVVRVHDLTSYIARLGGIELPSGGKLTVTRFMTMGLFFGFHGGIDIIHGQILRMTSDIEQFNFLTRATLRIAEGMFLDLDSNVIYAVLHEPVYCESRASNWAAQRVSREFKEFSWIEGLSPDSVGEKKGPLFFSGEMILPSMFESFGDLLPLREVADILAKFEEWPMLYDTEQLAKNEVPLYCAIYIEDMYVNYKFSEGTASRIKECKQFITNTMYHDALISKTEDVLKILFNLRDDITD